MAIRGVPVIHSGTRRYGIQWLAALSLMLLFACAPNVVVDYDKSADFSGYRTYGWGDGTPAKNPDLDRLIVEGIDEQMARKGFKKTDGDPDLRVTYHAATHEEIDYKGSTYGGGYGPAYGSNESTSSMDVPMKVRVGTIVVDMYDPKKLRNVWHGVGSDLVMDDPAKTSEEIKKGAVKMFEKFPPK